METKLAVQSGGEHKKNKPQTMEAISTERHDKEDHIHLRACGRGGRCCDNIGRHKDILMTIPAVQTICQCNRGEPCNLIQFVKLQGKPLHKYSRIWNLYFLNPDHLVLQLGKTATDILSVFSQVWYANNIHSLLRNRLRYLF